jgi:hypothetical protein
VREHLRPRSLGQRRGRGTHERAVTTGFVHTGFVHTAFVHTAFVDTGVIDSEFSAGGFVTSMFIDTVFIDTVFIDTVFIDNVPGGAQHRQLATRGQLAALADPEMMEETVIDAHGDSLLYRPKSLRP